MNSMSSRVAPEKIINEAMHAQADLLAMLGLGLDWANASKRCSESIGECEKYLSVTQSAPVSLEITAQPATPQTPAELERVRAEARAAGFDPGPVSPRPDQIVVEIEREDDGRWIAEVPAIPGAMAYGDSRLEAVSKALTLRDRVVLDSVTLTPSSKEKI